MTDTESITQKIAKLLKKAERAGTPEEADAFFAKAQELMTRYAIDQLTVHAAMKEGEKDPLGALGRDVITVSSSYANADALLLQFIAKSNDCETRYDRYAKRSYLYGYETDRLNVQLLYGSLLMVVTRQALDYGRKSGLTKMPLYIARRSFREAFAVRINERLIVARRTAFEAYENTGGSPLAPMIIEKKNAVQRYAEPVGKSRRAQHSFDPNAGVAGRRAADNADLGGPRLGGPARKAIG
jgi:hypothetical protein